MYASDYSYAADFNKCKNNMLNYNTTECKSNWLYKNNVYQWQLTPSSLNKFYSTIIYPNGHAEAGGVTNDAPIYPSFYLKSNLILAGGTGTSADPYIVG